MTDRHLVGGQFLLVTGLAVGACCLALALLTVGAKVVRVQHHRRLEERLAPLRLPLLTLATGEDHDGSARRALSTIAPRQRGDLTSLVVALLTKVRGAPTEDLVEVLRQHDTIEVARRDLGRRSAVRRARAARLLGLLRDQRYVTDLVPLLKDRSAEVRLVATRALGALGDADAAQAVLAAVCPTAAGAAGIPAATAAEALLGMGVGIAPVLAQGMHHDDAGVRNVAVLVAGHGLFSSTAPRLRVLLATDPDREVRGNAALALGRVGGAEDVRELTASTLPDRPTPLRRTAAIALGELGHPDAAPTLGDLLSDADRRLAQVSADALLHLGSRGTERLLDAEADGGAPARAARSALMMERLRHPRGSNP